MRMLLLLVTFFYFSQSHANTSVGFKEVEANGSGNSYQQAVNNALLDVIARTQGKDITSQKLLESVEASEVGDDDRSYYSSDVYVQQVVEKTQGSVLGFDVIDSAEDNGRWTVSLIVKVPDYKVSKSAQRQRIVLAPFKANISVFSISGNRVNTQATLSELRESLSGALVNTRKFSILEREELDTVAQELAVALSEHSSPAEIARVGNILTADFVLAGSIENLGYQIAEKKMRTSDKVFKSGSGELSVNVKLIEVATTQIVYSKSFSVDVTDKDFNNGVNASSSEILSKLFARAIPKIVREVTDQIYPLTIISAQNGEVILSEGGDTFKVGDKFKVFKRIERLTDPYTKEFLGWSEEECCTLEITRVTARIAYGKFIDNAPSLPTPIPERTFILQKTISKQTDTAKPVINKKPAIKESTNW